MLKHTRFYAAYSLRYVLHTCYNGIVTIILLVSQVSDIIVIAHKIYVIIIFFFQNVFLRSDLNCNDIATNKRIKHYQRIRRIYKHCKKRIISEKVNSFM